MTIQVLAWMLSGLFPSNRWPDPPGANPLVALQPVKPDGLVCLDTLAANSLHKFYMVHTFLNHGRNRYSLYFRVEILRNNVTRI